MKRKTQSSLLFEDQRKDNSHTQRLEIMKPKRFFFHGQHG